VIQLFTNRRAAELLAQSRTGYVVTPMDLRDRVDQCQETKEIQPGTRVHCLLPAFHTVEHSFGTPMEGRK
jgi:hypothetical protein